MIPLGEGVRVALDRSVRTWSQGRLVAGGRPLRVLQLSPAGRDALVRLRQGVTRDVATRRLGRYLVEAGLAHPRPSAVRGPIDVTVVVPTRDRTPDLDRCLRALGRDDVETVVVDDGSIDAAGVEQLCRQHGVTLVRHEQARGPGAARNTGLAMVRTPLVAFIDSDCEPAEGWLSALCGHLDDPTTVVVAPRIVPAPRGGEHGWLARYGARRSPLDMGPREGDVAPGRVPAYVPSTALLARTAELRRERPCFDPQLRHGEDVDLVWRLRDGQRRVRYEPSVVVRHYEPRTWVGWLDRRRRYGTAAAPLGLRHGDKLAHLQLAPVPSAAAAAILAGRPALATATVLWSARLLSQRLRAVQPPLRLSAIWAAQATGEAAVGIGRFATTFAAPVLALAAVRQPRRAALALLLGPPLLEWSGRRPRLDPLRWTLASIVDDAAYGFGVWQGCWQHRTLSPLRPRWVRNPSSAVQ